MDDEPNRIETIARGICVADGKILLCKPRKGGYTYLPGGHIEFGETGRVALEREIREEMGVSASATDFLGVVEDTFVQDGVPHAEINLVYRLEFPVRPSAVAKEDWIAFEWRDLADLDGANLLPSEMLPFVRAHGNR